MSSAHTAQQFDRSAARFDRWELTTDERSIDGMLAFCEIKPELDVLDVACGTGALALQAARSARRVVGVDVSPGMIELARRHARDLGLDNVEFRVGDVADLDEDLGGFAVAACRSAFHHMSRPRDVLASMHRAVRPGGVVCVQDIVSYDDPTANDAFEEFESLVDRSHHRTLAKRELFELIRAAGLRVDAVFDSETSLDIEHYRHHSAHDATAGARIDAWLDAHRTGTDTRPWWAPDEGQVTWRRLVCTIRGQRPPSRPTTNLEASL